MSSVNKPPLEDSAHVHLANACGTRNDKYGKARFSFQIGPLKLEKELIVAEIEDDGRLGMDVLQADGKESADIMLSRGEIPLGGFII